MKNNYFIMIIYIIILGIFIAQGVLLVQARKRLESYKPTFEVIDASRIDACTYRVGLRDKDGYYFALTQDLVKFAAMGVSCNDILIAGEE